MPDSVWADSAKQQAATLLKAGQANALIVCPCGQNHVWSAQYWNETVAETGAAPVCLTLQKRDPADYTKCSRCHKNVYAHDVLGPTAEHLCCTCYVLAGNPPADWHVHCLTTAMWVASQQPEDSIEGFERFKAAVNALHALAAQRVQEVDSARES